MPPISQPTLPSTQSVRPQPNRARIRQKLQNFAFVDLFLDELGWDQLRQSPYGFVVGDQEYFLDALAEKRGVVVFHCAALYDSATRRKLEHQVAKSFREHLIVYTNAEQTTQIWQWARREAGKPLVVREQRFDKGQVGEALVQGLAESAFGLEEEESLTLVDVTSRLRSSFDLERVTRRFYDRFKTEHNVFLKFIDGIPNNDDDARWYASVMLNRLMFVYFIQKKGFLAGDINYLSTKLAQSNQANSSFYLDFLRPFFFEGLAQDKAKRSPQVKALLGDVPYLNGGIFLMHPLEEKYPPLNIANSAFTTLFAFFEQYQWHLDERPLERDNEINPDVLGYIFEKYINQKQMGAYYTKEDITQYISQNTVIPFLLDSISKAVRIDFSGEQSVWGYLQSDPERYIYEAVRHGIENEVPPHIAAGIDDVAQRGSWNSPAPAEFGLPTEIWRETIARRQRCEELQNQLASGQVKSVNDLITLNLDIRQFAQDVITYTDSTSLIRAIWKSLNTITILDPTCGSGAFLFAALNILEPLYEGCLKRMEEFVGSGDAAGDNPQSPPSTGAKAGHADFRTHLEEIARHPNRRYAILKRIIINNLFGVDIMEEAIEICKLRLFLKLVAQVEDGKRIEPLPDIDFNIRAGNTLVGFATEAEVERALTITQGGQTKLLFGEDQSALNAIKEKAQDIARLYRRFREQQMLDQANVTPDAKAQLRRRLAVLDDELNQLLARQYGIDPSKAKAYAAWRSSHQPFHWYVEFFEVLAGGGFDVIIGNPPYVEYRLVQRSYKLQDVYYCSLDANNLYAYCMERATHLISKSGWFGMIVPVSVIGLDKTSSLRHVLLKHFSLHSCSTYGIRPSKLFDGVDQRLCIYLAKANSTVEPNILTTKYRCWNSEEREALFESLEYRKSFNHPRLDRFPQVGSNLGHTVIQKVESRSNKTIEDYYAYGSQYNLMHYHRSPRYWIRGIDFEPYFKSATRSRSVHHFRDLRFRSESESKVIGALLNSSLFFFWFVSVGNGRNITGSDINLFPIGDLGEQITFVMPQIFNKLMDDYRDNSLIRVRKDSEFQEFNQSKSKPIIDEIDRVLAHHYGFTDEELDFIINYDIKNLSEKLGTIWKK